MTLEKLIDDYENNEENFTHFSSSIHSLINALLNSSSIKTHSVSSRVKDRNSLQKKIEKKGKYTSLTEITDIVGVRIITHYSDEVDQIADLIEKEFTIDAKNSIDKRASLDPDRFGYLSLHYVASLSSSRSKLKEYKKFSTMKFEIQIRSILQHTWAEIEHDIGYKSKIEIPKPVRRKFSQLAGLLELADDQFIQIRNELTNYENDVQETIQKTPEDVSIDAISLFNYVENSDFLKKLEQEISKAIGVQFISPTKDFLSEFTKYCDFFKIETIYQLNEKLSNHKKNIIQRAIDLHSGGSQLTAGISIFYLFQVLGSQLDSIDDIYNFLNKMNLEHEDNRYESASQLYEFGQKAGLKTH
ncbi:GTP pyrophosphokinase [Pseudoalteromonas luteoviolacea]|uniref:RelA/SpoT domain-containing protein n=1 Tax=Pseudoalteromonas luteoviolacea H33 TaxID=1365251 RepID=A0A166ZZH1_9GAMM|nr:hypothetical protein [Pseudoalteromonas luteoviolacea]KZN44832.1 hypothetical protein N476_26090 [Pseudoalteromonas luteoviolacea H33]KZN78410.1 hypothetical protein N477_26520 [Pseudoalteromonas luteoviolacea H33-S]MBQ4880632.1 hypothetical protein [Pseudoalteromonas luteoviolacea]MBQ4909671.1 hypothetical protein [Pseudoalteromonas luteoviolacea]